MVLKEDISRALQSQKSQFKKNALGFEREILPQIDLNSNHILVVSGIRRCGKSTLLHQISKKINKESDSLFFNFEDFRLFGFELNDFSKLEELLDPNPNNYFFDEIQNVDNWEVYIRNLHDQNKKIYLTGSNASMLSKELGTRLTGRHIQIELFPFSYKEFRGFKKMDKNLDSVRKYLEIGGFPEYIIESKKENLQQLLKDILYRDIIVRNGIRSSQTFVEIAQYLLSNIGKEYSLNNIKKIFRVGSANSVADYVQWLEDAYVIFSLPRFSWSLKKVAVNPRKVYAIDTGFAKANTLSYTKDEGRLLENLVFLQLRRKYPEIFYFREKGECDFVVKEGRKITLAIQVSQSINQDNMKRELDGLLEALKAFDLEKGIIVTMDQKDTVLKEDKTIALIPVWEWLD